MGLRSVSLTGHIQSSAQVVALCRSRQADGFQRLPPRPGAGESWPAGAALGSVGQPRAVNPRAHVRCSRHLGRSTRSGLSCSVMSWGVPSVVTVEKNRSMRSSNRNSMGRNGIETTVRSGTRQRRGTSGVGEKLVQGAPGLSCRPASPPTASRCTRWISASATDSQFATKGRILPWIEHQLQDPVGRLRLRPRDRSGARRSAEPLRCSATRFQCRSNTTRRKRLLLLQMKVERPPGLRDLRRGQAGFRYRVRTRRPARGRCVRAAGCRAHGPVEHHIAARDRRRPPSTPDVWTRPPRRPGRAGSSGGRGASAEAIAPRAARGADVVDGILEPPRRESTGGAAVPHLPPEVVEASPERCQTHCSPGWARSRRSTSHAYLRGS